MSADANSANLDQHHFEWEIFARHMAELRQRMEAAAPRDPRIESGIPPHDRLEEEAFVRLTGLTRPGNSAAKTPQPEATHDTEGTLDAQDDAPSPDIPMARTTPHQNDNRISFSEPGVLDVDQQSEDDAFDEQVAQVFPQHTPAPNLIPEQSRIQSTDEDTPRDDDDSPSTPAHSKSIAALRALVEDLEKDPPNPPDSGATPHTPKRPLPLNTTLEELEELLQALEDQPRDGEE